MKIKKAILILSMCFLFAHSASSNEPKLDIKNQNQYPYGKALICAPTTPSSDPLQDFLNTRAIVFDDINGNGITARSHSETDRIRPTIQNWTFFGETDDASGYEICLADPEYNTSAMNIRNNSCRRSNNAFSGMGLNVINRETLKFEAPGFNNLSCKIYNLNEFENLWTEHRLIGNALKDEEMNIQRNKNIF